MALETERYEPIHSETGQALAKLKDQFDVGMHSIATDNPENHPELAAVIYQIQKMQEELAYLRGIINANNNKVSMTLGTSGSTALAGNTTTISTAQANAITANTAKTSFPGLGTSSTTALAGDTTTISTTQALNISTAAKLTSKIDTASQANINKSTVITFGEFTTTGSGKTLTYSLPITVVETDTSGKVAVTTTKTGSITLT